MGFGDVLKKSFLEGFASKDITTTFIVTALIITALIGLYIYGVYRIVSRRTFYSKSFNNSLVVLALLTAAIILTIQSSVVISLGMVGALSIVRFRTAIKDPMDLVFLFWSISIGIVCGAGFYEIAVIASLAVTGIIFALEFIPASKAPLLLIVNAADCDTEDGVLDIVKEHTKIYTVKSRNLTKNGMDMIIELRIKDGGKLVKQVGALEQIRSVSLLSHDGEVTY